MIITKIHLSNFGPFKNEQVFCPSHGVNNSLTLVFGDNMRGKTSLFNALKWVLYGEVLGRHKEVINPAFFLNKESKSEGQYEYWVELEFEDGGAYYRLRRKATVKEEGAIVGESSVDSLAILYRDDIAQSASELDRLIERIMPYVVSRFYLFDGEVLGDYELLLREDDNQGQRIAKAIENILGVPAVINAKSDLESLMKVTMKIVSTQRGQNDKVDALKERLAGLLSQQETLEKDRDNIDKELRNHVSDLSVVQGKLKRFTEIEAENKHLQSIEKELKEIDQELEKLMRERADAAGSMWLYLLKDTIVDKCKNLEREASGISEKIVSHLEEEITRKLLHQAVESASCSLCEKPIDAQTESVLLAKVDEFATRVSSDIKDYRRRDSEIRKMLELMESARHKSLDAGHALIVEREISRITRKQIELEGKRAEIQLLLRGHDSQQISKLQADRERHVEMKTRLTDRLDLVETNISACETNIEKFSQLIEGSEQEKSTQAADQLKLSRGLIKLFGDSVDLLRNHLRHEVEREASDAFKNMTTEKTFRGLKINRNYGLSIIDMNGDPQPLQSAGAAQVVAMSLIIALNRCSGKDAPLFVDTPFGRLDPVHRKNILAHLPSVAKQVVLLVQEGEVSRERDLDAVRSVLGAEYQLDRISSSHTRIKDLR